MHTHVRILYWRAHEHTETQLLNMHTQTKYARQIIRLISFTAEILIK